jgi:hypothetical protein
MREEEITLYCPDCRGRFDIPADEFVEEEIVECRLCAAEIYIISTKPVKTRVFQGDDDF